MEKFPADRFVALSAALREMSSWGPNTAPYENLEEDLDWLKATLREIGLQMSALLVDRMKEEHQENPKEAKALIKRSEELRLRIEDELKSEFFLHIPRKQAEYYEQSESEALMGKEVAAKWPRMTADIAEAGKCFALARYTASVFHLMRVVESGVQELGTKLGIALAEEKNWQNILDEVNRSIKALDQAKDPTAKHYAALSANLYAVKLAWRNEVMHPKDTYTEEEAEEVMRAVRAFLRELREVV